jgi:serine/threonine-protein kinase
VIAPGFRLGAYEIISALGAGGMGEVYRARDTRLKRDVALKVLPEEFSKDPDRLARFQREAELLASLNHPNIAAVYGLETSGDLTAIVLELVEGDTLADVIARGPITVSDALPIARQTAEALEAAHERGVIHRDLKPANIKVTPDGKVKVLDFGLAKMLETEASSAAMTHSPTLSVHATIAGVILGTAAYMSPEQARGRPVDRRTDVWAFGCVLFEMLTGRQVFDAGDTVSDAIASVLKTDPDWTALPSDAPPAIRTLLRRCLQKDPQNRLPHIGSARIEIEDVLASPAGAETASTATPAPALSWFAALPWTVAALALAGTAAAFWLPRRAADAPSTPVRLEASLGADASLPANQGTAAILSPDGTLLAFVGDTSGGNERQIYLRRLDQLRASPLSGTANAFAPFFSPDGQWLGFFADGKLKKVSVRGGAAVTLCDAANGRGGSWSDDGSIVFQPSNSLGTSLWRVSSAGGKPEPLIKLEGGEATQRWPQVLSGGKAVLYSGHASNTAWDNANVIVQALPNGPRRILQQGGYFARYVASGHILYIREGTLFALPFDLGRLEATGPPAPVLEGVETNPAGGASGAAQVAISATGTLVYVPGAVNGGAASPMLWMDHTGKTAPLRMTAADWGGVWFAPDGRRLAFDVSDGRQTDIWIYDWMRDTATRLTADPGRDERPVWTPDGRRVAFGSTRDRVTMNLYLQRADGTGNVQRLTESRSAQAPTSWHPSGKFLAFTQSTGPTDNNIMILPMEGDESSGWKPGTPFVFLNSPFQTSEAVFSPDGKWLAYVSNETGRNEVYVRPFPGPGGKWPISTAGGVFPTWSPAKRELFYGSAGRQQIMVASYSADATSFRADKPRLWSDAMIGVRPRSPIAALHPDGERFVVASSQDQAGVRDKIVFIFNFFDELRRVAPPAKR